MRSKNMQISSFSSPYYQLSPRVQFGKKAAEEVGKAAEGCADGVAKGTGYLVLGTAAADAAYAALGADPADPRTIAAAAATAVVVAAAVTLRKK
jgi:hypothetical protein